MKAVSPVIPGHEANEIKIAESQEQYETLPALLIGGPPDARRYVPSLRDSDTILARFELSEEEVARLVETRTLYYYQNNFGRPMQPVIITTEPPEAG
jgi:hypothetical protein